MSKPKKITIQTQNYRILRDYVKGVLKINATDLELDLAAEIGAVSSKSLEAKKSFQWSEAKKMAAFMFKRCNEKKSVNKKILRFMMFDFLLCCAKDDVNSEADEEKVNEFLGSLFGLDDNSGSNGNEKKMFSADGYQNLPAWGNDSIVIRNYYIDDVKKAAQRKEIVFLSGFLGTGKSFIATVAADSYLKDPANDCHYAIWLASTKQSKLTLSQLLISILKAFQVPHIVNLTSLDKVEYARECLAYEKGVIVIDGFDTIDSSEQREILDFLEDKLPRENFVIITSGQRIGSLQKQSMIKNLGHFHEIEVTKFTPNEWEALANRLGETRSNIKKVRENWPDLIDYVYECGKGNLKFMLFGLSSAADMLLTGRNVKQIKEYHLQQLDSNSYETALKRYVKAPDLTDVDRALLVTLSLFAAPVSAEVLHKVLVVDGVDSEGNLIEGSILANSISKCYGRYLLDSELLDGTAKFSLSMMRPIMDSVLMEKRQDYENIILCWLDYYKQFTDGLGLCFDDFSKLDKLDLDGNIENIQILLNFCEREQLWKEFYVISENTRYYFYTRGISGQGKNSIHYRRSIAAQKMNDPIAEFTSLLYHCNVSCKTKSLEGLESCFARLDELQRKTEGISKIEALKYSYIKALYEFSNEKYEMAVPLFQKYEKEIDAIIINGDEFYQDKTMLHDYNASLRWHSECLYAVAEVETDRDKRAAIVDTANILLDKALKLAHQTNFERAIVHVGLLRTKFYFYILEDKDHALNAFQDLKGYEPVIKSDASYLKTYRLLQEGLFEGEKP